MILVTGATGLVGSHIVFDLAQKGAQIRALYRDSKKIALVEKIFEHYDSKHKQELLNQIEWFRCDITDITQLNEAFKGCHEVYHCAATVSFRKKVYQQLLETNKYGTANLVNSALQFGIEKFAYISSTATIGKAKKGCSDENKLWKSSPHDSNYAVTKYMAEMEVWRGAHEGLNVCIVNPSIILGPGDLSQSSTQLFNTIRKGLNYYAPGSNAFVDVRDVSAISIQMMEQEVFNERILAIGENLPFIHVFEMIAQDFGVAPPKKLLPKWLAGFAWRVEALLSSFTNRQPRITKESTRSAYTDQCYDHSKAQSLLGYEFRAVSSAVTNAVQFFKEK